MSTGAGSGGFGSAGVAGFATIVGLLPGFVAIGRLADDEATDETADAIGSGTDVEAGADADEAEEAALTFDAVDGGSGALGTAAVAVVVEGIGTIAVLVSCVFAK